ncbi:MAG: hypothetical protein KC501_17810 [Myxococcales bacterium]|nr:hypothetical protein [Myxococcales bacterium]
MLGLGLGSASSCTAEPYACTANGQCQRGELEGACVAGFCAYLDDGCASGARYSPNAGELAGRCVEEATGSDGTGSESSSGDDPDSTGGGPIACGNGVVEADETCDDGNTLDGDGCSARCRPSGSEVWVDVQAGADGGDDRAVALGLRPTGGVAMAGTLATADGTPLATASLYALDGAVVATWTDDELGPRPLHGMGSDGAAWMLAGDRPSGDAAGNRAWWVLLDISLADPSPGAVDTLADEGAHGAVPTTRGLALVGHQDGAAWAHWVHEDVPDWRGGAVSSIDAVGSRADGAFVVVATTAEGIGWWLVSPQGLTLVEGTAAADQVSAASFDGEGRPVLGGVLGGEPWLTAYWSDASVAWTGPSIPEAPDGTVEALAAAPGGELVAAGLRGDGGGSWVARISGDGERRWSAEVLPETPSVRITAVAHDDTAVYVAGSRRGTAGDRDLLVSALEP